MSWASNSPIERLLGKPDNGEAKKPLPKDEDPEQSRRFLEKARAIEAAGELSAAQTQEVFEKSTLKANLRTKVTYLGKYGDYGCTAFNPWPLAKG